MKNCCVCPKRNFMHRFSETTFVIVKFRFVPKIRRNSVLCSREISLKRPQIVTRTFVRTFLESLREQRTKFMHFACVTFAQYCSSLKTFKTDLKSKIVSKFSTAFCGLLQRVMISRDSQNFNKLGRYFFLRR